MDALGGLFAASLATYLLYGMPGSKASTTGFSLNMAVSFSCMILWWVRITTGFGVEGKFLIQMLFLE